MNLRDLINALASEVELAQPQMNAWVRDLALLDENDDLFFDTLEQYSGQAQRMGEAADMVGFSGLHAVCAHVVNNCLLLPTLSVSHRRPMMVFLHAWPALIIRYLNNYEDARAAADLVDALARAPMPLDADDAAQVMVMLVALPEQTEVALESDDGYHRPTVASAEDVALNTPSDVDQKLWDGFFQEAPRQVQQLVVLSRQMAKGSGTPADLANAKRIVHTLKGSGATIGLRGLTALSHQFEDILEHFEAQNDAQNDAPRHQVAPIAAKILLDAAYCLEQMVGHITGTDEFPEQSLAVLQAILDLANRIDRGEALDDEALGTLGILDSPDQPVDLSAFTAEPLSAALSAPLAAQPSHPTAAATAGAALRVSVQRIEELFRISGEVSTHSAEMEAKIKALTQSSRDLMAQNVRLQNRLRELDGLVDLRAVAVKRNNRRDEAIPAMDAEWASFDALEFDQYSELQSTAFALTEEAADARTLSAKVGDSISQLFSVHTRQQRLAKDLQHLVISTRMDEVGSLESRLQRNVRSACQLTQKEATLSVSGAQTMVDRDVLTRLADPLMHILRNAVDHGLELPAQRLALGKPATGHITFDFSRQGQQVVLRCSDDGRGLDLPAIHQRAIERGLIQATAVLSDEEITRLIFLPGFSTRTSVNELSGRGIGLDVVREWARSMGGSLRMESSPGLGCTMEMRFAASLSTQQALIAEVNGQRFALPSSQIEQAVPRGVGQLSRVHDQLLFHYDQREMPAVLLAEVAGWGVFADKPLSDYDVVMVRLDERLQALAVDRLIDARELLVKNPGRYARQASGVAGLSILGDGSVAVIVDLVQLLATREHKLTGFATPVVALQNLQLPGILLVDDSLSVRDTLQELLQDEGFRVETARDGLDAIRVLTHFTPMVVVTDLEMPNMNGVEFTLHLRGRDDLGEVPVIMITSRSQEKHRRLAQRAGVSHYLTKPYGDAELLRIIRQTMASVQEVTA